MPLFVLPGQKKAMFIRTGRGSTGRNESTSQAPPRDVVIRPACIGDATSVARFLAPFVARGELLPRTEEELLTLLRQKSSAAPSPTHQKDVFGRWQDLAGLHGGGDALPN